MADILIQGGNTDEATRDMRTAIKDIFDVEPLEFRRSDGRAPGVRGLDLVLVALAIPPAIITAADLIARANISARLGRLLTKSQETEKRTGAKP